jgi:glycosyltransferase involved in cell wall biosynthesis
MALDGVTPDTENTAPGADPVHFLFSGPARAASNPGDAAPERRVALVGTYLPRKCGIATFTSDIAEKLREFQPGISVEVHAIDDGTSPVGYPGVASTIAHHDPAAYVAAARRINDSGAEAVWLQHEYGIFGGPDGEMVCDFVDQLAAPLVLTPHTVLRDPSPRQRHILEFLVRRASRIQVMSRHAADLLVSHYGAPRELLHVVPHGAPDRPFGRNAEFKRRLGLEGRRVLMTFGLLGPGKGLEHAIEAMPAVIKKHPDALYRIVGATHPNLFAREGEAYRERLQALARGLGVESHVQWDNRFLDTPELLDQLEACDIYLTPYPNLQQSTSGTLSYAVALGKAVVSTPYLHAVELLEGDIGRLVPVTDSAAIAAAVVDLLDDQAGLLALQTRAYARGRETIWPRFAEASAALVHAAAAPAASLPGHTAAPSLRAVQAMSDGTGMLQHSIGIVPDRAHGYCLDDNARALMLLNVVEGIPSAERSKLSLCYASFVQDAWNRDAGAFRNFMRFDRTWCEEVGSEDSNGRGLWALGQTIECAPDPDLAEWALRLYETALPHCASLASPRSIAFGMLGAAAVLRTIPDHGASRTLLESGGDVLNRLLGGTRRPDWAWFETVIGYDNPRLSQALIESAMVLDNQEFLAAGMETLEWIATQQISATGKFRPIGSESFGRHLEFLPFDQQPLEAQAAIEAARAAYAATGDMRWFDHAKAAWDWFFGANDRGVVLGDLASGRCRDGINPRGVNANCGAESILAFQLSHCSMLALDRALQRDSVGGMCGPGRYLAEKSVANS